METNFESEVLQRLTIIETKLSNGLTRTIQDHEDRVRILEKGFLKALGALAFLEVIGLFAIKFFFR
jgi:hypothetical protein